jgi:hypothetical protein
MPSTRLAEGEVVDQLKVFVANPALAANQDLIGAPGAGFKIVVYGYSVNASGGANSFFLTRGTGPTAITSVKGLAANAGTNMPPGEFFLHECNENEKIGITLSAATAVGIDLWYALQRVTP